MTEVLWARERKAAISSGSLRVLEIFNRERIKVFTFRADCPCKRSPLQRMILESQLELRGSPLIEPTGTDCKGVISMVVSPTSPDCTASIMELLGIKRLTGVICTSTATPSGSGLMPVTCPTLTPR